MNFDVRSSNLEFVCLLFVYQFASGLNPKEIMAKGLEGLGVIIWMCSVMFIKIFLFFFWLISLRRMKKSYSPFSFN